MTSAPPDPSTLAALHPSQPRELHYRSFRSAARMHGSHFMTLRRPSRLPESGREYRSGDPVGMIDWKAYARTDQLIVREVRDEATARVVIAVDVGDTMRWPDADVPGGGALPAKAEVALRVALNMAHVHLRMGDLVEVWRIDDGEARGAPSTRLKPRGPADLVAAFERMAQGGFTQAAVAAEFQPAVPDERPVDVAVWVGDALGAGDFRAFLGRGRRQLLLHTLSSLELAIDWIAGDTSYFDEGLGRAALSEYQGEVLRHRDNYAQNLAAWRRGLEAELTAAGGDYLVVSDRTAIAEYQAALTTFIAGAQAAAAPTSP